MADQYLLRVTAGPSYDPSTHQEVLVNTSTPTHISSPHCTADLNVRIQNYRGLPHGSPSTSSYFSGPHAHDQYSISFTLLPHKPIPGALLLFGNDFDHPVHLPPGFETAFNIARWAIDPGLDGDVYAEKPYLYGNALSSVNVLRVGEKVAKGEGEIGGWQMPTEIGEEVFEEGGDGQGVEWRRELGVPGDAAHRKKFFLDEGHKGKWVWEEGRVYRGDFFNPYLDFNSFALKLPGFSLKVLPYLGGEDSLRYVMKNKETGDVLFVVIFTLIPKDHVDKNGKIIAGKEADHKLAEAPRSEDKAASEQKSLGGVETSPDDVD
ncbi:MAG: hypothetical protein MMC33_006262 [Icmadophila ericetorum]|nr:hypothetical protein [Icmadophila ericetorum]